MPIDIAPKQQVIAKPAHHRTSIAVSGSENTNSLNRKVVLIKRSKSTGIVLKQKKQHSPYIKHHSKPAPLQANTSKHNLPQPNVGTYILPSEKSLQKDGKLSEQPATKTVLKSEIEDKNVEKANNKTAQNTPINGAPVSVLACKSEEAVRSVENIVSKVLETTVDSRTAGSSSNTSSSSANNSVFSARESTVPEKLPPETIDFDSGSIKNPSQDSKISAAEPLHLLNPRKPSLQVLNDNPTSKKNGMNTPPVSNINTTTNSDAENIAEEITEKHNFNSPNDPNDQHKHNNNNNDDAPMEAKAADAKLANLESKNKYLPGSPSNKETKKPQLLQPQNVVKTASHVATDMDINRNLSVLKSESLPMTPSYTTSTDNTNYLVAYSKNSSQTFLPKSPKEEEAIDSTKLSKKASLLKKKIVQRKNKNNVLKHELNDLIENLQMLKKQYDMISNAFGDSNTLKSSKSYILPESLVEASDVDANLQSYNGSKDSSASLLADNEISGYYFKRSSSMLYDNDTEPSDAFVSKKQKKSHAQKENTNVFMNNINLISDSILNTMNSSQSLKSGNENDPSVKLLTIQDILQQPDPQSIDISMNFSGNTAANNSLFNEKSSCSNNFDFFFDSNINLDDDLNMDFLNF